MRVALILNGNRRHLDVVPSRTLLDLLLQECGDTGVRHGCADGTCGECTVFIEQEPTRACLILAVQCDGFDVRA